MTSTLKQFVYTHGTVISLFFVGLLFCITACTFIDYDFGWHLQLGNYILHHGIPKTDPFSYTMPNYPFIDHEWFTNSIFALTYPMIGFYGFSLIFCALALFPLVILGNTYAGKIAIPLILLVGRALDYFIGIRPLIIDWVGAIIFFLLFASPKLWKTYRYILPAVMLLWVNLHGGFAIGIAFFCLFLVTQFLYTHKITPSDILIVALSILATFINPYGPFIWKEVFNQLTDTQLHQRVTEWFPAFYMNNLSLWVYLILSVFFVGKYWRRFSKQQMIFYSVLLGAGLLTYRHIPFWLLYSFPMTVVAIQYFVSDVVHIPFALERLQIIYKLFLVFIGVVWIIQSVELFPLQPPDASYPTGAIHYLQTHPFSGELLAPYEWGGYLIWQYPQKKVFIDGRMPSWRWQHADAKTSKDAMAEYENLLHGTLSLQTTLTKYHITRILFFQYITQKSYNSFTQEVYSLRRKFLNDTSPHETLYSEIKASGMHVLYQDPVAVIYGK